MKQISNCPVCNSNKFKNFINCEDFTVSHENFDIVECESCNFRFTNPIPELSHLGDYYESEDYISHSNTSKDLISKIYQIARKGAIRKKHDLVKSRVSGDNWLDIGCGTGDFMHYCEVNGLNISGIEPSDKAREFGVQEYGLEIFPESKLEEFAPESFDAITMWHVLEHVYPLQNRVKKILSLLRPNGVAFIAVPNCNSLDAKIYKEHWAAYDVPRHLYHFRQDQMKQLWEMNGGKVQEVLPMKLDSYYVSLLSEKYKGSGIMSYPKAFFNGLRSNHAAVKSGEWSSLIYVVGKG
jgi:2-polyprenyl-3-methyl-5-hydroxy-6-metoxy-1,4-benzoquinol methylase